MQITILIICMILMISAFIGLVMYLGSKKFKYKKPNPTVLTNSSTPLQKKLSKIILFTYLGFFLLLIIAQIYLEYRYTNGDISFKALWNYPLQQFIMCGALFVIQFAYTHKAVEDGTNTKQANFIRKLYLYLSGIFLLIIIGFCTYRFVLSLQALHII